MIGARFEIKDGQLLDEHGNVLDDMPIRPVSGFRLTGADELMAMRPVTKWLIKDYLPTDSLCLLYGESGTGKSFMAIDMACHIALGKEWCGKRVKQGSVVYIAGEGNTGMAARIRVWSLANHIGNASIPLAVSNGALILPDDNNFDDLVEAIGNTSPALVIIDTLARNFFGEENSAKDAGAFIHAIDAIRNKYQCCVLLVHHSGKDALRGGRGSSAFKAAMDMEMRLTIDDAYTRLTMTKAKEVELGADLLFTLESVSLGEDWLTEDGELTDSAAMRYEANPRILKSGKVKLISNEAEFVLIEIVKAINASGVDMPAGLKADMFPDVKPMFMPKVIEIDGFRKAAYAHFGEATSKAAHPMKLTRVLTQLFDAKRIGRYDEMVWLAEKS